MRTLIGTLLAAALLVSGCSAGSSDDDLREARVGEVFDALLPIEGRPVSFTLPTAGYDFLVGGPRSKASSGLPLGEDDVSPEAGDDTAFIEIEQMVSQPWDADTYVLSEETTEWKLWLDVDGRTFPLDRDGHRTWVVTVPKDPDEVRLVAEYDGKEFAVDPYAPVPTRDTGSAYAPGRLPRLADQQCPDQRQVELADGVTFDGTDCRIQALDPVPWFGPVGWAAPGKSWVLVKASIDINTHFGQDIAGDYVARETEYGEPTYRLDGAKPVAMYDSDLDEISSRPAGMDVQDIRWALFEVDEDTSDATLRLGLTYTGTPKDSGDDAEVVTHRWKHAFELRFT